ncbi:sodium:calcium antiporter [Jiella sonneratiae]|uniref:Sodium:calcium antiporter n=1 Tax=Jiella sonneratiae TaxID=2816856 RepID=A0ABS3J2Z6_9HYPH|nr:sodium:calcium antiporter [Jiella sonneratiae]MBO0904035.1 sodium:calcium antiporter [Jiella sonneratiae]
MIDFESFGFSANIAFFLASAAVITYAGVRVSHLADELADRTGLGEVVAGALFVGASTSLPGAITSVSTAVQGFPALSIGNALGGLTAQTLFIAVADVYYRRANLEHAAATPVALAQGLLLLALLSTALLAANLPHLSFLGVHPASYVLPIGYLAGLRLLRSVHQSKLWQATITDETREEVSDAGESDDARSDGTLWGLFALFAGLTALAGYVVGEASIALVSLTGVSETLFGTTFTAIANSLPELVTAVAAVRIGAVSLAVGDIIGGNAFEILFLSLADFVTPAPIYADMKPQDQATGLFAMLMVIVVLLGMLKREKRGAFNIGFESVSVFALYAVSVLILFL